VGGQYKHEKFRHSVNFSLILWSVGLSEQQKRVCHFEPRTAERYFCDVCTCLLYSNVTYT